MGLAQGQTVGQVSKQIGVTEQTYYRWRKEYGGLRLNQAKRLKVLEKENARLKKLVADLFLDKQILKDIPDEEARWVAERVELATHYGRYGYRRITAMLRWEGWKLNHKRVEGLWRQEGLKVPSRQPQRRRLWLHDGSCVRLRAAHKDQV